MYELARKHCGRKDEWRISLPVLQKKCGSGSTAREFKRLIQNIVQEDKRHDHMPDYAVRLEDGDMVVFRNRGSMSTQHTASICVVPPLDHETYHDARVVAPGWDVYFLEQQWRDWITEPPRNTDAAFIGFCKKWYAKRGTP